MWVVDIFAVDLDVIDTDNTKVYLDVHLRIAPGLIKAYSPSMPHLEFTRPKKKP